MNAEKETNVNVRTKKILQMYKTHLARGDGTQRVDEAEHGCLVWRVFQIITRFLYHFRDRLCVCVCVCVCVSECVCE